MTSFMFKSGIESLEQAIKHFQIHERNKEPKHLRFGLIHLDGAIELILKESLKSKGINFLRGKATGWYGVFNCLREIREDISRNEQKKIFPKELSDILYLNEMELLHELRNSAQHLGVYHSADQLQELIPKVLQALQAYLKLIFDLEINGLDEYLVNIGKEKDAIELYLYEADITFNQGNISMAFLQKYIVLEKIINDLLSSMGYPRAGNIKRMHYKLKNEILENEVFVKRHSEEVRKEIFANFFMIRETRNKVLQYVSPLNEEGLIDIYRILTQMIDDFMDIYSDLKKSKSD